MTLMDLMTRGMRPHHDGEAVKIIVGTGLGLVLGVLAGLLFAPRSGDLTRQLVVENAHDVADIVKKTIKTAVRSAATQVPEE